VLVSIQSLIFVDQPFYNEPGAWLRPCRWAVVFWLI
jgi:hypothetical protein